MDKPTKIKVLNRLRTKRNELESKIHKKTLEVDRIMYKKMRGNWTFDQMNKMHNQIKRGYEYIEKWTTQLNNIDKKIHYIRHSS